ncbi:unnamed protein product [Tilletia laevis]|uniref:non-specific serine/threonine protein kinase n=2 Tax=Tilletia TaxID=13289 RepID=A0A177VCE7_9BASI|nr:hypothetical protein CF336_g5435 [Tilletia laevis]KAE8193471.1 hypothetical protein CF328_g5037 [Tilletia controversa]KAE8257417.1 hypothetical protein A4X03_0g4671 [Tilletia caries]CAD6886423.1 unnamed protein product [Tilletia caries]CAD6939165.1 unnamed protein product [Tilletia laevis]
MVVVHRAPRQSNIYQAQPAMHQPQQHQQQQQQQTAAPTALSGYEPLDVIGNGTFGIIRKVRRLSDDRMFARKELNFERMSERDRKQIVAEVNILRTLGHDNIVKYEERFVDKDRGILYIVMEYCEGGDLGSVIKRYRRSDSYLQEETVWCYLAQMTRALDACHYRGIPPDPLPQPDDCSPLAHIIDIDPPSNAQATAAATAAAATAAGSPHQSGLAVLHRDLKPENVFLDALGNIKLGDFGLSKQVGTAELARTYVGTPYYMSPELATGGPYDAKSDIWALGCIAYELCARKPPFDAANQADLTIKIKAGEVPHLPAQYSPELGKVIRAMLSLNPRSRPTTRQLLQVYQIQLCLKHLDVNTLARNLIAEREELRYTQNQLEAAEAEIHRREAALQATPSSITDADRQAFAARVAELEEHSLSLSSRLAEVEAREAKVAANEIDQEKRRADLEKKYLCWYEGERKRAEEVLRENRERAEEMRVRRESRERARAVRKSGGPAGASSTTVGGNSSAGEGTGRSGRGSGASEDVGGDGADSGLDASEDGLVVHAPKPADGNVTTRTRRPPRVSAIRGADATGGGEMSYIAAGRYMNTTGAGTSIVLPTSSSARNMRTFPQGTNVLPARRIVSGPRASRISIAAAPTHAGEQTTTMMDVDTSVFGGHAGGHHLHIRERLLGVHPVGSPRSVLRGPGGGGGGPDTSSARLLGRGLLHHARPPSAARLGGLLGAGGDEVVVEMDQSPAPASGSSAVSSARSVKAARVSRAQVDAERVEEDEDEEGEAEGGEVGRAGLGGSGDEWIDQDAMESGGSARTSTSPSLVGASAMTTGMAHSDHLIPFGSGGARGTNSAEHRVQPPGVDLHAWRGRGDEMELEEDDSAETDNASLERRPVQSSGGGREASSHATSGFDSDVAMESPVVVKVRQAYRRSMAAVHQNSSEVSSLGNQQHGSSAGGVPQSPSANRLQQHFGRLHLGDGQSQSQAQQSYTPPMPLSAPTQDCDEENPLGPAPAGRRGPMRATKSSDGLGLVSSPSAVGTAALFDRNEDDLPSPFIKRVTRIESPVTTGSAGSSAPSSEGSSSSHAHAHAAGRVLSAHQVAGNSNHHGFSIRSSSSNNLLAKAVAGSAAAAQKLAAAEEHQRRAGVRAAAADIENQRPTVTTTTTTGVATRDKNTSIYPALPVSDGLGAGAERASAYQAIRARRQSATAGLVLGSTGTTTGAAAAAAAASATGTGTARGAAALSTRPSVGAARRLSTAAGVGVANGAPPSRILASGSSTTGLSSKAGGGVVGRTSLKPGVGAGGPGASRGSISAAATANGPPTVPLGGANVLIPGAGRRRSILHKRE